MLIGHLYVFSGEMSVYVFCPVLVGFLFLFKSPHWVSKPSFMCAKLLRSCLTLHNPMDCSPPGSSVHGILQTRILEWVAMPSSRSFQSRDQTHISYVSLIGRWVLYHLHHLGSPDKISCISEALSSLYT